MSFLVVAIVAVLIFVISGFRYNENGVLEQGSLIQFGTIPGGATVQVDGKVISGKTPSKTSLLPGPHAFSMSKDGYETWQKTLNIASGTLTWLNYARLVPTNRPVEKVADFSTIASSLASTDGRLILLQPDAAQPTFRLADLGSDDVKQTILTLPATVYTSPTPAVTHTYRIDQWDKGGRYVLLQHTYGDKKEWIVMDTSDVASSKNVTKLLDIDIQTAVLSGTSGNILYELSSGDIRKIDLSAATISRSLVSHVTSFNLYSTDVISYVGTDASDSAKRVVGLYREGDNAPHVLRTITDPADVTLHIDASHYFSQDYVAIAVGKKIDVLSGTFPSSGSNDSSSLSAFGSFYSSGNVESLSFSPLGYYVLAQTGPAFSSFDIEHQTAASGSFASSGVTTRPLQWLDESYIWADIDGNVTMREFDGANVHAINPSIFGQAVTLTKNGKFLYSVGKSDTGVQLQRVKMIL